MVKITRADKDDRGLRDRREQRLDRCHQSSEAPESTCYPKARAPSSQRVHIRLERRLRQQLLLTQKATIEIEDMDRRVHALANEVPVVPS